MQGQGRRTASSEWGLGKAFFLSGASKAGMGNAILSVPVGMQGACSAAPAGNDIACMRCRCMVAQQQMMWHSPHLTAPRTPVQSHGTAPLHQACPGCGRDGTACSGRAGQGRASKSMQESEGLEALMPLHK